MAFLILMMLLVVSNVMIRFWGGVIASTYELVELMSAVAIAFCIIYACLYKTNITVDVLISRLSERVRSYLEIVTSLLSIGAWGILTVASTIFTMKQWTNGEITDILGISITPFRFLWVFALAIISLVSFIQLLEVLNGLIKKWTR